MSTSQGQDNFKGMIVSLIVAMGKNFSIGLKQGIPWHLSGDLKRFREITIGHHLVMGRKTFEAIGRPLPERDTLVITSNPHFSSPGNGVYAVSNLEKAIQLAERRGETEVFICGGGVVYREALPLVERMYLTLVDYEGVADTYFPAYNQWPWKVLREEFCPAGSRNAYPSVFRVLEREEKKLERERKFKMSEPPPLSNIPPQL